MDYTSNKHQQKLRIDLGSTADSIFKELLHKSMEHNWYDSVPSEIYSLARAQEKLFGIPAKRYVATHYPEYLI